MGAKMAGGMTGAFVLLAASFLTAADVRSGAFAPLPDPVGVARPLPDLPEEVFQPACAVQGAADGKVAFFVFAEHGGKGVSVGWVGPLLAGDSFY